MSAQYLRLSAIALLIGVGTGCGNATGIPLLSPPDSTQIAAGNAGTCMLSEAGNAICWGLAAFGEPSRAPWRVSTSATFASITAGNNFACALSRAGSAFCWG